MHVDPLQGVVHHKMLHAGRTVDDGFEIISFQRLHTIGVGDVTLDHMEPFSKQLLHGIAEIVEEHIFQPC